MAILPMYDCSLYSRCILFASQFYGLVLQHLRCCPHLQTAVESQEEICVVISCFYKGHIDGWWECEVAKGPVPHSCMPVGQGLLENLCFCVSLHLWLSYPGSHHPVQHALNFSFIPLCPSVFCPCVHPLHHVAIPSLGHFNSPSGR